MKLYEWQEEVIERIEREKDRNFLLVAPTGAGKSLVNYAFLGIFNGKTFRNPKKRVIYTVPIKSLANDKFFELKNLGLSAGLMTGDAKVNTKAKIIVCTQEVYQERFRGKGYSVVIDEFHYAFQNPDRALSFVDLSPQDRYLFASATVKVTEDFLKYLERISERKVTYYQTDFRPTKLMFMQEPLTDTEIFLKDGVVLSVGFTRRKLTEIASELFGKLPELPEEKQKRILEIAKEMNLKEEILPYTWRKGIFVYHGKLNYTLKVFVERLVREKLIRTVVSTDAISLGVNFPVSDVVFFQLTKFDGKEWRPLLKSEFLQIAGRAGRKELYEEGRVWAVENVTKYENTFEIYRNLLQKELEPPRIEVSLKVSDLVELYEKNLKEFPIEDVVDVPFFPYLVFDENYEIKKDEEFIEKEEIKFSEKELEWIKVGNLVLESLKKRLRKFSFPQKEFPEWEETDAGIFLENLARDFYRIKKALKIKEIKKLLKIPELNPNAIDEDYVSLEETPTERTMDFLESVVKISENTEEIIDLCIQKNNAYEEEEIASSLLLAYKILKALGKPTKEIAERLKEVDPIYADLLLLKS